jgi:hypothetical protein
MMPTNGQSVTTAGDARSTAWSDQPSADLVRPVTTAQIAPGTPATVTPEPSSFVAQPTLILGVGGIGHRIVLALKAHLVRMFGEVPAGVRLLVLDIDDENLSQRVGARMVTLEHESELFSLGPIQVARLRHNIANHPTIEERLHCLTDFPPITAARAANALRPIGSLAFQWQFPLIQDIVHRALWSLAGRDAYGDQHIQVDARRGLKVIQIGSLCGGTNSGMFIDAGFLIRHELEELGLLGDSCISIGVGMLPGAFRGTTSPNLAPNTVAALRELEAVMLERGHAFHYRNGVTLDPHLPPFDMYLLVDAVDETGRVWVSRDDLCTMVSRALFVLTATSMGEQGEVQLDNVNDILGSRTHDGHGTFFGSIGLAVLELPAEELVDLFMAQHLQTVLNGVLLQVPPEEADAAATVGQGLGLTVTNILADLARDDTDTPLALRLELPPQIRQVGDDLLPLRATQYVADVERVQLRGDFSTWIRLQGEAWVERVGQALREQARAVADDPTGGLPAAHAQLESVAATLAELGHQLATRLEQLRSEHGMQSATAAARADLLIDAGKYGWPLRRRQVRRTLQDYLRAAEAELAVVLQLLVAERAQTVVGQLRAEVDALLRATSTLETRLVAELDNLTRIEQAAQRQLRPRHGHPALVLIDPPYLERLFGRHAPPPAVTAARLVARLDDGLLGLAERQPEAIGDLLWQAAVMPFAPLLRLTVEEVIAERRDISPRQRLAALRSDAVPAVSVDLTRLPGGDAALRRIEVLGVPDQHRSIFQGEAPQLVSTHDSQAVVMLSLTVGVPYPALQAWPDYLAEYERCRGLRLLHTLPEFQARQQEHKLALALGLVFELVTTRGAYFYYQPADDLSELVRLAQGGENTLRSLAREVDLVREILERVEQHIERIGTDEAITVMEAWSAADSRDDELARDLKRQVREYAGVVRRNAQLRG